MAQWAQNEAGDWALYDQGQWRPATPAEVKQGSMGVAGSVEAAFEGATGARAIAGMLGAEGEAEKAAAMSAVNPMAENIGFYGSLATGGAGLLPKLGKKGASTMAERVVARDNASRMKTSQGFVRNFEEALPANMQGGGQIIRSGAETYPVTRMITDALVRNPNQRNLNRLGGRALGATDNEMAQAGGKISDELMGTLDARNAAEFDVVGTRLNPVIDQDQVVSKALELADENIISNELMLQIANNTDEAGQNIMSLRSELGAAARAETDRATKIKLTNRIAEIDEIVKEALGEDQVTAKLWSDARARYKLRMSFDKGQAWGRTNDINAASMDTALKSKATGFSNYKTAGDFSGMPADIGNFLKGTREAQTVNVGVPSSGTAERLAAMSLLSGAGITGTGAILSD